MCAVSCLISGQYPQITAALEKQGVQCYRTEANPLLPKATAWHPDLQFLKVAPKTAFIAHGLHLKIDGYIVYHTKLQLGINYPGDCLCNCLILRDMLFCNSKAADPAILEYCEKQGLKIKHVNQGYTKCSALAVDEQSLITADATIAAAAEAHGITVLRIQPGFIQLPGYDYGFIGGTGGRVGSMVFFAGSLHVHPNETEIRGFIKQRNLSVTELTEQPLIDIGGIIEL